MDVVFDNVPARLTEKETRPFQNSAILQGNIGNGQGCPVEFANVIFTTLMKTVLVLLIPLFLQVYSGKEAILCLPNIKHKAYKVANSTDAKFSSAFTKFSSVFLEAMAT